MGHADAQRRKVELGLIRALDEYDIRKLKALQWMVRWGFSTSKILNELFLSRNDLTKMESAGLVENFQIGFKKDKDSRPIPTVIWFPTRKGRVVGKVLDRYIGKRFPSIELVSHDLIAQAFVCERLRAHYGGFRGSPKFGVRPARMIAKMGIDGLDLAQYLPDAVFGVPRKLEILEVERSPILSKSGGGRLLEQYKFCEKLNHLVATLKLPVTLLYMTDFQAIKNKSLLEQAANIGYPDFYALEGSKGNDKYWPHKEVIDGEWVQEKKKLLFDPGAVKIESLDSLDLSKWLP